MNINYLIKAIPMKW